MTRIRTYYLVRHGETEWNRERRMQGQWHSGLNEDGKRHADESGRFLATRGIDIVYASPLGRVQETAAIIRPYVDIAPINDDRLMEWSSGDWSGFLYSEIAQKWPAEFAAWQADMLNVRAPGGENFHDLMDRARSFLSDIADSPGDTVAIYAHGFINRALACALMDAPATEQTKIRQSNDTIMRIRTCDPCETHHFIAGAGPHAGLPGGSGPSAA